LKFWTPMISFWKFAALWKNAAFSPTFSTHDANGSSLNEWVDCCVVDGATGGTSHAGPGAADCEHVSWGATTGAEADAWWAPVPADPQHVSGHGRQDHWHAARDWQLGTAAHAGVARVPQGKGLYSDVHNYAVSRKQCYILSLSICLSRVNQFPQFFHLPEGMTGLARPYWLKIANFP